MSDDPLKRMCDALTAVARAFAELVLPALSAAWDATAPIAAAALGEECPPALSQMAQQQLAEATK